LPVWQERTKVKNPDIEPMTLGNMLAGVAGPASG
jgi:hypothetical protein